MSNSGKTATAVTAWRGGAGEPCVQEHHTPRHARPSSSLPRITSPSRYPSILADRGEYTADAVTQTELTETGSVNQVSTRVHCKLVTSVLQRNGLIIMLNALFFFDLRPGGRSVTVCMRESVPPIRSAAGPVYDVTHLHAPCPRPRYRRFLQFTVHSGRTLKQPSESLKIFPRGTNTGTRAR